MDIDARIRRRQRRANGPCLVQRHEALSPVAHVEEPSGRAPAFERLLDHLDPVFDGSLPPNGYVYGPPGAGKSAVVTALFDHLARLSTEPRSVVHAGTRAGSPATPGFVYVDVRETTSEFAFYHAVLDALVDESVPEHGVGTAEVRDRLRAVLDAARTGVVVAVDHVGEPGGTDGAALAELFAGLPSNVSWLAVGRVPPEDTDLATDAAAPVHVGPYGPQMLADVLMTRASDGLARGGLDHDLARRVADWADGDAHDALTALLVAADRASRDGRTRVEAADVEAATAEVPRPSVSLGRVLALPANKRRVLRALVDLDDDDRASVTAAADAVAASPDVDLSRGTVERFLYELAEAEVLERVQTAERRGKGRPPSRVELRFSPAAFRRLDGLRS
jgi:Cdc6-like AAA superfamily ATPase